MLREQSGLDSPALRGRLRHGRRSDYERRPVGVRSRLINDFHPASQKNLVPSKPPQAQIRAAPYAGSSVGSGDIVPAVPDSTPAGSTLKKASYSFRSFSGHGGMGQDVRPAISPPVKVHIPSHDLHVRSFPSRVLKREAVQAPRVVSKKKKRKLHHFVDGRRLTAVAAIFIILGGVGIGLHGYITNKEVATKTEAAVKAAQAVAEDPNNNGGDIPSETKVGEPGTYKVAPDKPRVIRIAKIGVHARVVRVGTKANNQMMAPANIFDAGWYDASSKPGEAGAMVLDGHVSGPTKHGVFYDLHKLVKGDVIEVERGDGTKFSYRVVASKVYDVDKVDMTAALTPVTAGKAGLNIITCDGDIDTSGRHYTQRRIVFAEKI